MESSLRDRPQRGLCLIETMAWTGHAIPRLPLHLARLHVSARRLGWACDDAAQALLHAAPPATPARLRLTLQETGAITVTASDLPAAKPVWRVGVAEQRLDSGDSWLSVKSSHRPAYDAARASLPADCDELILLNERDEVCDGTITTVFFDRGHGLRTPPLSCGVLPGVLRAALNKPTEVLAASDLPHVRLWIGNSLRGLIAAEWSG